MAREATDYRANLEMLRELYPGKIGLSIQESCALLGRNRKTLLKDRAFPAQMVGGKYFVPITALARYMS